jgi:hypothetical protein
MPQVVIQFSTEIRSYKGSQFLKDQMLMINRSIVTVMIIASVITTLILAILYSELILTVINFLTLKMSVHGLHINK